MNPTVKQKNQMRQAIETIYQIGDACWAELEPFIYIKEIDKNNYFSKAGETTKELSFIFDGILRIYYLNEKGEEWNKHFLLAHDFVASSISPEKKAITTIQALTKSTLLCISYSEIARIAKAYNVLNIFIQKLTFLYLEQKQNREISLLSEDAMHHYLSFKKLYPNLENKIQHYHIASYLGITPTQLSRLRKKIAVH